MAGRQKAALINLEGIDGFLPVHVAFYVLQSVIHTFSQFH